jgi:hypothetical protein
LPSQVAARYGHIVDEQALLERQLQAAVVTREWEKVRTLSQKLTEGRSPAEGQATPQASGGMVSGAS